MHLDVPESEIWRYLGYRGAVPDDAVRGLIASCLKQLEGETAPKRIYRVYPLSKEENAVTVGDLRLESRHLRRHLEKSTRAALFAATLGSGADRLLRYWERVDMSRAAVLQASAAAMTEVWCDLCQAELAASLAGEGARLTFRFSPGYGDLSLACQPMLLARLDAARRIGLTVTESMMLTPTKSVTAVIGIY